MSKTWSDAEQQQVIAEYERDTIAICPVDGGFVLLEPADHRGGIGAGVLQCSTCQRTVGYAGKPT